jgi:hypothetical protein
MGVSLATRMTIAAVWCRCDCPARARSRSSATSAGVGGPLGRSLFRAAAGIRLFGAIRQSWFLAVGRLGGVAFALAELGLALWLGRRVLARLRPT